MEKLVKKYSRHSKILKIIQNHEVETQDDLSQHLKNEGINVTQATVSRDIKELKLVKVLSKSGKYRYASIEQNQQSTTQRLIKIFKSSILSVNVAGHFIVLKTLPGAAQISGFAIDSLEIEEIAGTIAGDDTIFIAVSDKNKIKNIISMFDNILN